MVFVGDDLKLADAALASEPGTVKDVIAGAAGRERFKGKPDTALTHPGPGRAFDADRLIVVGIGGEKRPRTSSICADLGGFVAGKVAGRTAHGRG